MESNISVATKTKETGKPVADVVVGVDGTEGSILALKWALDRGDRFGNVRTVTTYQVGPYGDAIGLAAISVSMYEEAARARALRSIDAVDPSLMKTMTLVESSAGSGLVEASAESGLLVVGCRGRSGLREMLLGSVGSYCVKHSQVPVAVVAGDSPLRPLKRIAVGVDGSANALAALRWAVDHVDDGGVVQAVGSFNPYAYAIDGYVPPIDLLKDETEATVQAAVAELGTLRDGVTVSVDVRNGDARRTLREAGDECDLLVVGARGHRRIGYLLLGSVTTSLLHHPTCVTVVVPDQAA